jgi:hypothetical protein
MRAPAEYESAYADTLFYSPQPSSSDFGEREAFRHYLHCLRQQVVNSVPDKSFTLTCDSYLSLLDELEVAIHNLNTNGIRGESRCFSKVIDASRSAIAVHKAARGAVLNRMWCDLI